MSVISIVTNPVGEAAATIGGPLLQLAGDEADRHDAEALGRLQQPLAGALAGGVVLEPHLPEAGQRVADVGRIVDRQAAAIPSSIDVGEGAVGQSGALGRVQAGHGGRR